MEKSMVSDFFAPVRFLLVALAAIWIRSFGCRQLLLIGGLCFTASEQEEKYAGIRLYAVKALAYFLRQLDSRDSKEDAIIREWACSAVRHAEKDSNPRVAWQQKRPN